MVEKESQMVEKEIVDKIDDIIWEVVRTEGSIDHAVDKITTLISQHYIPKQDTGFEIVRECEESRGGCGDCTGSKCMDTGKITEPLTIQQLIKVVGKMVERLNALVDDLRNNKFPKDVTKEMVLLVLHEALTYNGGNIRLMTK